MKQFDLVVCGGTFDHLHLGHKEFLRFVASKGEKMLIGLTTDSSLIKKPLSSTIQPFQTRKNRLETFLQLEDLGRFEIEAIDSLYIPQKWEKLPIQAIIATEETAQGVEAISKKRAAQGLLPLEVIFHSLTKGQDGKTISSFRIRSGEINRDGRPYVSPLWLTQDMCLPLKLRSLLQKPFGEVVSEEVLEKKIRESILSVTVGDIVTKMSNSLGLRQQISVVDLRVQRRNVYKAISDLGFFAKVSEITLSNEPGRITGQLFRTVIKLTQEKHEYEEQVVVHILGEEDLAVLPFTVLLPLSSVIVYGQPGLGMVLVQITEEKKEKAYGILQQFTTCT